METACPLVSVIVPVYNSELYLEYCLQSVINQTCRRMEIILVNDGCTDCSPDIINAYAAKDERIVTLSQPNRGVSAARNARLSIAKGEYIFFVDSDDTVRDDAVETLCRQAVSTGADVVIGNTWFCYPEGKQVPYPYFRSMIEFSKKHLLSGVQCFSQLMEAFIFVPLVYQYFTKRDFIMDNRLFFEEGIVQEDELWCIKALINAKQVSVTLMNSCHYFYHSRPGSLLHSDNKKYRVHSYFSVIKVLEAFVSELEERNIPIETIGWIHVRMFYIHHAICQLLQEMKAETNEYRAYFEQLLKKVRPSLTYIQQQACMDYFINGNRLLYTHRFGLTLSFCITCMNRFHQIRYTLRQNLEDNKEFKDLIEFVLVDFGSTDGLQEWVAENFVQEIEEGYLKYYYTEEMKTWHNCIAKNTTHILANNQIVVNLDCDNFTGKNGGLFVIDAMIKNGWEKTVLHQYGNELGDGTFGRIALSKANFLKLGGYDESLEPAGYQDLDLYARAQKMGLNYINISDKRYSRAILNTKAETIVNTFSELSWEEMHEYNRQLSIKNIASGKLTANTDKDHIGVIDNIYTF